jgi:hypothetical protein
MSVPPRLRKFVEHLFRWLPGETVVGTLAYFRFPERRTAWGGPFNGQLSRHDLFVALIERIGPTAIVETGTYLGTTTEVMADTGLPTFSIEANRRFYGFARARLWRRKNVRLFQGDSRAVLRKLFANPKLRLSDRVLFFYLDAHWNDDLPLLQELNIIFARCSAAIVMVDDFKVPFDAGYGYDNYGPEEVLCLDYIAPIISRHGLRAFYPSTPSVCEKGMRRGCVVLAKRDTYGQTLSSFPLLRAADDGEVALRSIQIK